MSFELITKLPNPKQILNRILSKKKRSMDSATKKAINARREAVSHWADQPTFSISLTESNYTLTASVIVGGTQRAKDNWKRLKEGVPPHIISPIESYPLVFIKNGITVYTNRPINHPGYRANTSILAQDKGIIAALRKALE